MAAIRACKGRGRGVSLFWLLAGLLLAAPAAAQDLADFYRELQIAQPNAVPDYADPAAVGDLPSAQAITVAPDDGQDFLRITRGQADGSALIIEIALWLDREGAPLLGISERRMAGDAPIAGRMQFYSRASGRWNDITNQALGSSVALCGLTPEALEPSAEGADVDEAWQHVAFFLPRTGVDLRMLCLPSTPRAGQEKTLHWHRLNGAFGETAPSFKPRQ